MRDVPLFFVFGALKNGVQQSISSWRSTQAELCPKILDEYIGGGRVKKDLPQEQQDFLRHAMDVLGMTRGEFAERIGAKKRALDNWLLPSNSAEFRAMPDMAWKFIREILDHLGEKP